MKKTSNDELRPEYDLAAMNGMLKGKYAQEYSNGTNIVLLEKGIAEFFPDAKSVNDALRSLVRIVKNKAKRAA
jgi:hypothetical protein